MMQPSLGAALKLVDPRTGELLGVLHVPANVDLSRVQDGRADKIPLRQPVRVAWFDATSANSSPIESDFFVLTRGYCPKMPDGFSIIMGPPPHELAKYPGYAFAPSLEYIRAQLFPPAPVGKPREVVKPGRYLEAARGLP